MSAFRLALFSGNYNYTRDGANMALNRLVEYFGRAGAELLVFSPTSRRPAFAPAGRLISVPSIPIPFRPEYRLALGLSPATKARLAAFKPDAIHLSAPDLLGLGALKLARQMSIPAVASVHTRFETYLDYYGLGWLRGRCEAHLKRFYGRCAAVYAPSESVAEELRSTGIVRAPRIWSRGVDHQMFTPAKRDLPWRRSLGIADNEPVVTFVSRLVLEKGLGVFAEAVDRLAAKGLHCKILIVGDGPERARFERRMPNAVFTGCLTGEALARAYASADIFMFPSITETFGNVTLEAMASGLPTICADAAGSRTLVDHEATGYLAPPNEADDFARLAESLICDAGLRRRMGAAARAKSEAFGWDAINRRLLMDYKRLLAHACGKQISEATADPLFASQDRKPADGVAA